MTINEEIVLTPVKEKMIKKKLQWFGHMQRPLEEIIIRDLSN